MADSFEDFLKSKNQKTKPVDWIQRKNTWTNSIDTLYESIRSWLSPFTDKNLLTIQKKRISIYEEYIGDYEVMQLDIIIGNNIISLIPIGTIIFGSYGRIDIRGPKDDTMIVEKEWNEWKFVDKYNRQRRWNVNDDSFKIIIQKLING